MASHIIESPDDESHGSFHQLVESQHEFFLSGQSTKLEHRIAQLKKLRKIFEKEGDTFCEAVYKDLRRKYETTEVMELSGIIPEIDYTIENLKNWIKPVAVEKNLSTLLDTPVVVRQAKGVVLLIGPWNYPIWTVIGPLIAIIAAGNTVIIKPSEVASHTAEVMDRIFSENFDKNYLAVVQGDVSKTTDLLTEQFDHIMYTGSTLVGHIVMNAAAKNLTTVTLELGGKSPTIVLPDADIPITARRVAWGKWLNCGQTCIAPDYILTTPSVKPKLVAELIAATREFYGEDVQKSEDYSRIINGRHFNRLSSLLEKTNGEILFKGGEPDAKDLFLPPTILDLSTDDIFMKDEIFGPILPIVTVQNIDDAIEYICKRDYPLALYLFTRNENVVDKIISSTRSGAVCVNDVILHAASNLPFGGVGKSGMGRYRRKYGFDEFTHEKPILKRGFFGESLASARYPPLTKQKVAQLSRLSSAKLLPPWVWRALNTLPYIFAGVIIGYFTNSWSSSSGPSSSFRSPFRH